MALAEHVLTPPSPYERLSSNLRHALHNTYGQFDISEISATGTRLVQYARQSAQPSATILFPSIAFDYVVFPPQCIEHFKKTGDVVQVVYPPESYDGEAFVNDLSVWISQQGWEDISLFGVSFGGRTVIDLIKKIQDEHLDIPVSQITTLGTVLQFSPEVIGETPLLKLLQTRDLRKIRALSKNVHLDHNLKEQFGPYISELISDMGLLARVEYLLNSQPPESLNPIEAAITVGYWEKDVLTKHGVSEVSRLLQPDLAHSYTPLPDLPGMHGQLWNIGMERLSNMSVM